MSERRERYREKERDRILEIPDSRKLSSVGVMFKALSLSLAITDTLRTCITFHSCILDDTSSPLAKTVCLRSSLDIQLFEQLD